MSRAYNSLKTSDVIVTPIKLKYSSSYASSSFLANGIKVSTGTNIDFTATMSIAQDGLTYRMIRHMYYSNFLTGSALVSASYADNFLQSTAASGTLDADIRFFPTGNREQIKVIAIPRSCFGEKISRRSFNILPVSGGYQISDDGNGNLIDVQAGNLKVGNIFYSQGIAVITNQSYLALLT